MEGLTPDRKVLPTRWWEAVAHRVRCKITQLSSTRRNNNDVHWTAVVVGQWPFWQNHGGKQLLDVNRILEQRFHRFYGNDTNLRSVG